MSIRTFRLDQEGEKALAEIVAATGLSVSATVKKALLVLRNDVAPKVRRLRMRCPGFVRFERCLV